MASTLTLEIPDGLYQRLLDTAQATDRPLADIVQRVLEVGSPPSWSDVPEPFQADLATLDQLDNETLWGIAYSKKPNDNTPQIEEILESSRGQNVNANPEQLEALQFENDRFMLRKAQAAAILRWRGCHVPLP
ncbi:MAG: hypothetical protein AAGD25_33155 [Cyanobacteria bacterium P01_F01_bin.150]